jgi:uncharacterized protein (TIGR03084 family)
MQQAEDCRQECHALAAVLDPLGEADFDRITQFKDWTLKDVIGHLHIFNAAAEKALEGDAAFQAFLAPINAILSGGGSFIDAQAPWLAGLRGRALFEAWRDGAERCADLYARADPKQRVSWAGPGMSARSGITARQTETWAHGQEIFDLLGLVRTERDRIRNIAHMGVATYGWTFANRGLAVPGPPPHVRLTGPSGAIWEWNDPQQANSVSGDAVAFAQVVTQVRNIADTTLVVHGEAARRWMEIAQCFAGAPTDPPAPGTRHRAVSRPPRP